MDRDTALEHLYTRLESKNLRKHSLAVEAIMGAIAIDQMENEELFSLAGLMHDIDLERVNNDMSLHSMMGGDILEGINMDDTVVYAVRAHNAYHQLERRRKIDKALFCADPISGFITAAALIKPEKSLKAIDVPFLMNRFQEKGFAKGANREQIATCSELGYELEDFMELSLSAMRKISDILEL